MPLGSQYITSGQRHCVEDDATYDTHPNLK